MALNTKPINASFFGNDNADDYVLATSDNDTLTGGGASINYLSNSDNDTLQGGFGDDIYVITSSNTTIIEYAAQGLDTLYTSVNYTLPSNVEYIAAVGATGLVLTGNTLDNRLDGLQSTGTDTLLGMAGNDMYFVDSSDKVIEGTGVNNSKDAGGIDTLVTANTVDLSANSLTITGALFIENLVLTGQANVNATGNKLANYLTGNAAANSLVGGVGNDSLDGSQGTDTLVGGAGDDFYYVDNAGDTLVELSKGGADSVLAAISWTLGNELENVVLTSNNALNATGNALNNNLTGNALGNNLLGNDGNDYLTGNAGNDSLDAGAGNDTLIGGVGADVLAGGAGNDVYFVDNKTDTLSEMPSAGTDSVQAPLSWTLSADLENLTLTGNNAINGTGNAANNLLLGNAANNVLEANQGDDTLDGGAGADSLSGGLGADTYLIDNSMDSTSELSHEGIDTVQSPLSWTLSDNLENLTLTGVSAVNGVGNSVDNWLLGNKAVNNLSGGAGNDSLDGGAGSDKLDGGAGNDVYYVDNKADTLSEQVGAGIDTVMSPLTWTLGNELENLTLTGALAINAAGNGLANVLIGNKATNNLTGGAGADTLVGGMGKDTISVGAGNDVVRFGAGTSDSVAGLKSIAGVDLYNDLSLDAGQADRLQLTVSVANVGSSVAGFLSETSFVTTMNALLNTGSGRGFATDTQGTVTAALVNATAGTLVGRSFLTIDLDGSDTFTVSDFIIEVTGSTITNLTTASFVGANLVSNQPPVGVASATLSAGTTNTAYLLKAADLLQGISDADNDPLSINNLTANHGTIIDNFNGSWTLNPESNYSGVVTLSYSVTDNHSATLAASQSISFQPAVVSAGFIISPQGNPATSEAGATASYSIALSTAPLAGQDVSLLFTSSDSSEATLDNPLLTFSATNWATAQTLVVRGVDDNDNDGNVPYLVTATLSSLDVFYKSLFITPLQLTNLDDTPLDVPVDLYGDASGSKIDVLSGNNGNDKLHGLNMADNLSGGVGNDTLWGGYGDDNLFGNAGDDYLWGEQENDYLDGGTGADTLDGGTGADTMIGGAGSDTYYLGYDASDVIADGGLETDLDTVIMPYQLSSYTLPTGIENGTMSEGAQPSRLTGNTADNSLNGNSASNTLEGGLGRDSLFAGVGDDLIDGGLGNDVLTGGAGNDIFSVADAVADTITDFNPLNDTIQLNSSLLTGLPLGALGADAFVIGNVASSTQAQIVYNSSIGAVFYDDDGVGQHTASLLVTLGINLSVTHSDFVVV